MTEYELKNIHGGVSFTSSVLNAIVKSVTSIYDIGRRIGSALVRYKNGTLCR